VLSEPYGVHQAIIMVSKYPQMNKQNTTSKKIHVTLIIPQKLYTIRGLESGESTSIFKASHRYGSPTTSDVEKKDHVQFYVASHGSVKGLIIMQDSEIF
jgi:hypothetical protein